MSKLDELSVLLAERGINHIKDGGFIFVKNCRVMEHVVARDSRPEHLNEPIMGLTMEVFDLTPEKAAEMMST
jgi:hypothetical protein